MAWYVHSKTSGQMLRQVARSRPDLIYLAPKPSKSCSKGVFQVVRGVYEKPAQDGCHVLQELSSAACLGTLSSLKANEHLYNPPVSPEAQSTMS